MSYCESRSVSSHALQAKPRSPGLSHARLTERVLREAGQIDEGPEDEHLGTGAFPLTWSTGTGGSDRGWYRPARDLWHYWPASGWFNLRRMTPSLKTFESSLAWCAFPVTDRKSTKWRQTLQAGLSPLSLIHISEPTRQAEISYAVFCLKKKKKSTIQQQEELKMRTDGY